MTKHKDFILKPVSEIIKEAMTSSVLLGDGIETYPLSEYVLQSMFIRMTGSQEQKMKCICWELATHDYKYRYDRYTDSPLGQCSSLKEKTTVYKDLIMIIRKLKPKFDLFTDLNHNDIRDSTLSEVTNFSQNTTFSTWVGADFLTFSTGTNIIRTNQFARERVLLESVLQQRYEELYDHRNRCAHNTKSYQENLPTLNTLIQDDYRYDNYVVRFALLVLIDKIFISLYEIYCKALENEI